VIKTPEEQESRFVAEKPRNAQLCFRYLQLYA